jgi:hypothetical protein
MLNWYLLELYCTGSVELVDEYVRRWTGSGSPAYITCYSMFSNWSLLENATLELGDELGDEGDWVRLYMMINVFTLV